MIVVKAKVALNHGVPSMVNDNKDRDNKEDSKDSNKEEVTEEDMAAAVEEVVDEAEDGAMVGAVDVDEDVSTHAKRRHSCMRACAFLSRSIRYSVSPTPVVVLISISFLVLLTCV